MKYAVEMGSFARPDNKVRELATVCLPWQQWTETSLWFDDVGTSAFFFLVWHCGHSWPIVPASGDSEDDCGEQMECRLAGETEVLGENLPQRHFCPSQNPTCLEHQRLLKRLREKLDGNDPKFANNSWILHYDNAPAHTALSVREF
jgi:hypothetical protein